MEQPGQNISKPKKYLLYRILGFINNFMAVFFLFVTMMSVVTMGLQSTVLLYLFIFVAILIYTNLSTVFVRHVMIRGKYLRKKLKDWIKVNAIVALLFGGFMIISISFILSGPEYMQKVAELYSGMEGVTEEMQGSILPIIRRVLIGFLACMVFLVAHVLMTFSYLKKFAHGFKEIDQGN